MPAELTYIVVIGDISKLELDDSDESGSGLIDLPIRGYLTAKPASRESWQAWINQPGFTWTKVTGGMLSYPPFREDQMRVNDENSNMYGDSIFKLQIGRRAGIGEKLRLERKG